MLNSGKVPNLFDKDELEQVLANTCLKAKEAGISQKNGDKEIRICSVVKHICNASREDCL